MPRFQSGNSTHQPGTAPRLLAPGLLALELAGVTRPDVERGLGLLGRRLDRLSFGTFRPLLLEPQRDARIAARQRGDVGTEELDLDGGAAPGERLRDEFADEAFAQAGEQHQMA